MNNANGPQASAMAVQITGKTVDLASGSELAAMINVCHTSGMGYRLGRPGRRDLTNIAVPREVFRVRTWNFDTWFRARASKHCLEIAQETKIIWLTFCPSYDHGFRLAARMSARLFLFFAISKKCLFKLALNHVSKFQVRTPKIERGYSDIFHFLHFCR